MKKLLLPVLIALLLTGCSASFTTANITETGMTSEVVNGSPTDLVTEYSQDTAEFYVFGILNNAPDDTTVRFVWNYLTDPQKIYEVEMNSDGESGIYVISSLTLDQLWPIGDYSVDIYIDNRDKPDATVEFSVK